MIKIITLCLLVFILGCKSTDQDVVYFPHFPTDWPTFKVDTNTVEDIEIKDLVIVENL